MSFLPERGVCSAGEVAAMLQRHRTVCCGSCFAPGWVNLDCSPSACPQPSTHWSHRLFTGISLHSSHYPCRGRFSPTEQSSHSLALNKVSCRPSEAEEEWKAKKMFWSHSGETKIFGVRGFFGREEGALNCCLSELQQALQRALSEPRVDTEHGVSSDYLTLPAQTSASLPGSVGKSPGRWFSFPQHPLSHFHAVWSSVVLGFIHAFHIW